MKPSVITNALFAGLGALDARNRGKRDARIASERFNLGRSIFGDARSVLEERLAKAEPYMLEMLETAREGADRQNRMVADIGDEGFRAINDANVFGSGRINQNLARRGFSGSSMHGAAFRGLASDLSRGFGNLTSQLAGVRSNTLRAALQQLMSAQGAMGAFQANAGNSLAGVLQNEAQAVFGVGHMPAQGVGAGWGQVGEFLGGALDEWIGSPSTTPTSGVGLAPGEMGPGLEYAP